jgi:hypothetical protein
MNPFTSMPVELVDSKLFKFEVILPSVYQKLCVGCSLIYPDGVVNCHQCGEQLVRQNKTVSVDIATDVSLNYEEVENQLPDIPAQFSFWAAVYAEAKYRVNILERVVKTARAVAHDTVLQAALRENTRLAQDSIKQLVEKDERVNHAEGQLAQAHMVTSKLYYMVEAIRMKGDLARTLTSLKRSEQSGS